MGSDGSRRSTSSALVLVGAGGTSLVPALLNGLGSTFTCVPCDSTMMDEPISIEPSLPVELDYSIDCVEDDIGLSRPMSSRPHGWYQEAFKKGKRRW